MNERRDKYDLSTSEDYLLRKRNFPLTSAALRGHGMHIRVVRKLVWLFGHLTLPV